MSIIAIAVKHLISAGVTGDALVTAITEMENELNPVKSTSAIRQQRYRDRNALRNVTFVTPPSQGFDGFLSNSLSLNPNSPPKENPPKGGQKKIPHVTLPDWMPMPEWDGFKEMRVKIKKPMTTHAQRLAIDKLERFRAMGHDPTAILNQSILNDYQDLYELKREQNATHFTSYSPTKPTKDDRARAAVMRAAIEGGFAPGSTG